MDTANTYALLNFSMIEVGTVNCLPRKILNTLKIYCFVKSNAK